MRPFSLVAAVLSAAALASCGTPPPAPVQQAAPTTTTTADVPGADPKAWFEAYCGPMGVSAAASRELRGIAGAGPAAAKDAVVRWVSLASTTHRKIAADIQGLGALGSDVRSLHDRLVRELNTDADGFGRVAARLAALPADGAFLERYEQSVAVEMGNAGEQVTALFNQIATTPKYAEAFRSNEVCSNWQGLATAK